MCDVPPRSWRGSLQPVRVTLVIGALACTALGGLQSSATVVALLAVAGGLALAAVVVPVVREVEFGFPVGLKVVTAARDREQDLRSGFEAQKADLELCAQLLCDDPEDAVRLLEAAWSRTAAAWRGPPGPELRLHTLCGLVHLVTAQARWTHRPGRAPDPLGSLTTAQRVAVVLLEFAELTPSQVARLSGRSEAELAADLVVAEGLLATSGAAGPS